MEPSSRSQPRNAEVVTPSKKPPKKSLPSKPQEKIETAAKAAFGEKSIQLATATLKERATDLSVELQKEFEAKLEVDLSVLSGFSGVLEKDNKTYDEDKVHLKNSPLKVEEYKNRREEDGAKFGELSKVVSSTQEFINTRITHFKEAIDRGIFEKQLLTEEVRGNRSHFKSSYTGRDHLYGIPHRLEKSEESLDSRRGWLNLTDPKTKKGLTESLEFSSISLPSIGSEELASITHFLHQLVELKEEVLTYNEALRETKNEVEAASSYAAHQARLEELQKELEEIKLKKEARIKALNQDIEIESSRNNSKDLAIRQYEKAAIEKKWFMIQQRENQIAQLLSERKKDFGIENGKEEGSKEKKIVQLEPFSEDHQKISHFLKRVAVFKEEALLGTENEYKLEDLSQRRALYLTSAKDLQALKEEKKAIEEAFSTRIKVLDSEISNYNLHINALQKNMEGIQRYLKQVKQSIEKRREWKLDFAESKSEVSANEPPSEKGFLSWLTFGGSKKTEAALLEATLGEKK